MCVQTLHIIREALYKEKVWQLIFGASNVSRHAPKIIHWKSLTDDLCAWSLVHDITLDAPKISRRTCSFFLRMTSRHWVSKRTSSFWTSGTASEKLIRETINWRQRPTERATFHLSPTISPNLLNLCSVRGPLYLQTCTIDRASLSLGSPEIIQ